MAIELDQDIMVTNMCVKVGEDWTDSFQELDRKQSSGRTYGQGHLYIKIARSICSKGRF